MTETKCEECSQEVKDVRIDGKGMETVPVVFGLRTYKGNFTDRGGTPVMLEQEGEGVAVHHDDVCDERWTPVQVTLPPYTSLIDFIGVDSSQGWYHYVGKFMRDPEDGDFFETEHTRFRLVDNFIALWKFRHLPKPWKATLDVNKDLLCL